MAEKDKYANEMLSDEELDNVVGGAPGYNRSFEEIKKRTMENIKKQSNLEANSLNIVEINRQKLRLANMTEAN